MDFDSSQVGKTTPSHLSSSPLDCGYSKPVENTQDNKSSGEILSPDSVSKTFFSNNSNFFQIQPAQKIYKNLPTSIPPPCLGDLSSPPPLSIGKLYDKLNKFKIEESFYGEGYRIQSLKKNINGNASFKPNKPSSYTSNRSQSKRINVSPESSLAIVQESGLEDNFSRVRIAGDYDNYDDGSINHCPLPPVPPPTPSVKSSKKSSEGDEEDLESEEDDDEICEDTISFNQEDPQKNMEIVTVKAMITPIKSCLKLSTMKSIVIEESFELNNDEADEIGGTKIIAIGSFDDSPSPIVSSSSSSFDESSSSLNSISSSSSPPSSTYSLPQSSSSSSLSSKKKKQRDPKKKSFKSKKKYVRFKGENRICRTWSKEDYDRKGTGEATKLNYRDLLELEQMRLELQKTYST